MTETSGMGWRTARGGPVSQGLSLTDLSRVGEARRAADAIAVACGLDEEARSSLAIVTTEAATNLARHATDGVMYIRDLSAAGRVGVEIVAIDSGPGMHDVSQFATDGFSTGGTSGTGMGAMRRLASEFDVYSQPGKGTAIVARVFQSRSVPTPGLLRSGVICLPINGETVCGDGWRIAQDADRAIILLVDGLGHGPSAAEAADVAGERFMSLYGYSPLEILEGLHEALRSTRGAAVGVTEVRRVSGGAHVTLAGAGKHDPLTRDTGGLALAAVGERGRRAFACSGRGSSRSNGRHPDDSSSPPMASPPGGSSVTIPASSRWTRPSRHP